ncbi:transposase, partial [uncultured Brachyspira sp.]
EKFAEEKNHINGIENFWNQAKRHLRKFNGIPKEHFHLFIKECQFRFNNPKVEKQLEIIYNLARKELF